MMFYNISIYDIIMMLDPGCRNIDPPKKIRPCGTCLLLGNPRCFCAYFCFSFAEAPRDDHEVPILAEKKNLSQKL